MESEVAHPLYDTRTNCSRVSGRKGEVIKRVESKTTGSTGHNAISFLSHPPYRVSLSSPPFTLLHTLPTTYCGSCYLYLFNPIFLSRPPIHLSAPFVRSLIFRRRAGGGRAYKVSRGRRSALVIPSPRFLPREGNSLWKGGGWDRDRGKRRGGGAHVPRVLRVNETNRGSLGTG